MRSLLALSLSLLFAHPATAAVVRVPVATGSNGSVAGAPQVQAPTLFPVAAVPAEALFAQKLDGLAPAQVQKHAEFLFDDNLVNIHDERPRLGPISKYDLASAADPALRGILRHAVVSEKSLALLSSAARLWAQEQISDPELCPAKEDIVHFWWRKDQERRSKELPLARAIMGQYEQETGDRLTQEHRERLEVQLIEKDERRHGDIFGSRENRSPIGSLARHSLSIDIFRFLLETKRRVDQVYRRFFPSFHQDEPKERLSFVFSSVLNGRYVPRKDSGPKLALEIDSAWTHDNESEITPGMLGGRIQRKIAALLTLAHERAHQLFDRVLPGEKRSTNVVTYYDALNEGFAVTLELLAADKMVAAREELGLSAQDVRDMREWKRLRLSRLRANKNHYTFGTLYFWHRILKREGEAGIFRTLGRLRVLPSTDLPFAYGSRAENDARGESLIADILSD